LARGKGPVVSAIEVIGCCQEISHGLVGKINRLLPEAKVVTITQIADAQIKMNHMMSRLSAILPCELSVGQQQRAAARARRTLRLANGQIVLEALATEQLHVA
jgi:hypothetical protein